MIDTIIRQEFKRKVHILDEHGMCHIVVATGDIAQASVGEKVRSKPITDSIFGLFRHGHNICQTIFGTTDNSLGVESRKNTAEHPLSSSE